MSALVYVVVGLYVGVFAGRLLARDQLVLEDELWMLGFLVLMAAVLWPLVVVGAALWWSLTQLGRVVNR